MSHSPDLPNVATGGEAYGFVRDGYARADAHELKTADIESATVYGRNDVKIGSIRSLKVGTDGAITNVVIDVGGFLGFGTHSVIIPFSDLTVLRKTNGSDVHVHLDTTKDRLKAMPQYNG